MFIVPGRSAGPGNGPNIVASPPVVPTAPILRPHVVPVAFLQDRYIPGSIVADPIGAIWVPAQPAPQTAGFRPVLAPGGSGILPPGDPALGMILSYLYAWLVLDGNANVPWTQATGWPLIKSPLSLFTHNPKEADFNIEYLPALYLWRDDLTGGTFEHAADDWYEDISVLTLLWVLPPGDQFRFKDRSLYAKQFVDTVYLGIERNMTPSWVQPGDPWPYATQYGSQLGQYLKAMYLKVKKWSRAKVRIQMSNGAGPVDYPAVEMKFEICDATNNDDIRRFGQLRSLDQRISNPTTGSQLEHEIDY